MSVGEVISIQDTPEAIRRAFPAIYGYEPIIAGEKTLELECVGEKTLDSPDAPMDGVVETGSSVSTNTSTSVNSSADTSTTASVSVNNDLPIPPASTNTNNNTTTIDAMVVE